MRFFSSTSVPALAVAMLASPGAWAQTVNTSPSNVNVLNLLSPFLNLNATTIGQQTLRDNLDVSVGINNGSSDALRAQAISDKTLVGSTSTITLANGSKLTLGPADNLAGGLPLQAIQNNPGQPGTIAPFQSVGGYGYVLGADYQTGIRASTATTGPLADTFKLLTTAYNVAGADLGVAKNFFANGAASNPNTAPPGYVPTPAVAPPGYTLPTADGLPNSSGSVYDIAYGVKNTDPGQNVYGDSRPVQVAPDRIDAFDPTALNGLSTNASFPSGHTTYAFTDSILLAMLTPSLYQSQMARGADYANDRIVLGVHYALDIIGSRALASYDLAQEFTNPLYINNAATTSGTAIDLPTLFTNAKGELASYLSTQCGAAVATCATSSANLSGSPYAPSAETRATYQQRLTYGLPTLSFAQAPQEAAPAGGPDASILLATVYGGDTAAAKTIAPTGGIDGSLATSTINQIVVNTETNALAAFYGTPLSYWSRVDLYSAAGYFGDVTGTLTMAAGDRLTVPATIASGGTLYGNGATISGNVTAQSGGAFGGGSGAGAANTTVDGTLTMQSGSKYFVTATNSGVSNTKVAGKASIGGSTLQVTTLGSLAQPYSKAQILNASGGVNGTFANVTTVGAANAFVNYDANTATVTLDRTDINYAALGATPNQRRVATAIGTGAATVQNDTAGQLVNNLYANAQTSAGLAQASLDRLSGEGITASENVAMQSSAMITSSIGDEQNAWRTPNVTAPAGLTLINPLPGTASGYADPKRLGFPVLKGAAPAPLPLPRLWRVWGGGFGATSTIDGVASQGTARQTDDLYGGLIGLDYQVQPNFLIGAAAGGTNADFSVSNRATTGSVTGGHGAVYATYGAPTGFYIDSSVAFSGFSNDVHRTAGGVGAIGSEAERASFDSFEVRVRGEIGQRFSFNGVGYNSVGITPFAAVEYANLSADGFTEKSAATGMPGLLSLAVNSHTTESLPVFAGLRIDGLMPLPNGMLARPFAQVAYVHEFDPSRNLVNNLVSLPGASFLVEGARPSENAAQVKAGVDVAIRPGISLTATFDGEFSGVQTVYGGKGGLRVSF